jgi:hypothetical protein
MERGEVKKGSRREVEKTSSRGAKEGENQSIVDYVLCSIEYRILKEDKHGLEAHAMG